MPISQTPSDAPVPANATTEERASVFDPLIGPAPGLRDAVVRRQARLLAALTLALAGHALLGALTASYVHPPGIAGVLGPTLAIVSLGYLLCHCGARTTAVRTAAFATIALQVAVPAIIAVLVARVKVNPLSCAAWMTLALLTTAMTLRARAILLVGALLIGALVTTMTHVGAAGQALGESITFLVAITLVLFVQRRHRDALESIRQAELRERNHTLQVLRVTLEERVVERTADLANSNRELHAAYRTLEEQQAALLTSEKMAAVGRLTAGFAHELASPLGAIQASLLEIGSLCDELDQSIGHPSVDAHDLREVTNEARQAVDVGQLAATRAAAFVRGLRNHTRDPGPEARERFDARAVVQEALTLVAHAARAARASVTLDAPADPIELVGVPSRLNQIVTNLVANAIDAVGEKQGGRVDVRLSRTGGEVRLEVADDGVGIPAAVQSRVFEPLFTTKPSGKGTGLGLAIVADIIQRDFGGFVDVSSTEGQGTVFTARFTPTLEVG